MSTNYSPESRNPRDDRARVDFLIRQASISGLPADKIAAVEAGNAASRSAKGFGLGEQALRAVIKDSQARGFAPVDDRARIHGDTFAHFINDDAVRRYRAVQEALGTTAGITIVKPETKDELLSVVRAAFIDERTILDSDANMAIALGSSMVLLDCRVEGTLLIMGAVRVLGLDKSTVNIAA